MVHKVGRQINKCFHVFFLKKIGNLDMTLVKDSLTINLICEQVTHEYSLGKRIF